jgi:hypothetical protein
MARNSRSSKTRPSKSRPSKMGRKWTQDDFLAYKIKVVYQDLETFFGVTDLPLPNNIENPGSLKRHPFSAQDFANAKEPGTSSILRYMNHITRATDPENRKSNTIALVRELLDLLYYTDVAQKREMMMWLKLQYLASQGKPPQVDICIMHEFTSILLVVKVDRQSRGFDPEPRLISDTIAVFHNDNIMRVKRLGTDPLISKVMPGIVMKGSMPTFYKILVTPELVKAVESGERPEEETIVHAYRPEVPSPEEGMKPLDNRYIILSCFEAFRKFL